MNTRTTPTTLQELYDQLNQHDWFYDFSDDHRVWQQGEAEKNRLIAAANAIQGGFELYLAFGKHHFTGEPWGNTKQPKPERPA